MTVLHRQHAHTSTKISENAFKMSAMGTTGSSTSSTTKSSSYLLGETIVRCDCTGQSRDGHFPS